MKARWRWIAALMACVSLCMVEAVPAQDNGPLPGAGPGVRRDGHKFVRLTVRSIDELNWLESIGAEAWSCIPGVGQHEFSGSPQVLALIEARGIRYQVLNDNIQATIDAELARMNRNAGEGAAGNDAPEGGIGEPWFDDYKTWTQVNQYIDSLVAMRPDLISKLTVGTTIQGRTMVAMRITSPVGSNKPAVMFTGCQHAREWVAVMVPMFIADALIRQYDTDAQIHALMDSVEFFIVPVVNPDGYEYTYAPGGNRLWRKNRRNHGNGSFGVDLNRNWGVDWGGPNSTSTSTSSDVYIGASAFSEPESAAVRDFFIAHPQIRAHIDFHSYAQVVLQNWAHTVSAPPDLDVIDALGTAMNNSIFAVNAMTYANGWGSPLLYLASGVMPDWCYGDRGIISYTIELRDKGTFGFELPPDQIFPTCSEALPAALTMAQWVANGVEFFFPRGRPAVFDPASQATVRVEVRSTTAGPIAAGSVKLYSRAGSNGSFASTVMSNTSGVMYQALLPSAPCGQIVQWYVEAQASSGLLFRSPADAPVSVYETRAAQNITNFDFETTAGWTTSNAGSTGGLWTRVIPTIDPSWSYSPRHDADTSSRCYVTGNSPVNSDVSNGTVTLTSPVLNLRSFAGGPTANGAGTVVSYACFLHATASGPNDVMLTEMSANDTAGPWVELDRESVSGGNHWRSRAITQVQMQSAGLSLTSTMRVRFRVTDGAPVASYSVVEAGIDAVRISDACEGAPQPCPADVVGSDGDVNIADLLAVIAAWGATGSNPADLNGDNLVNIADLLAVIAAWGPCT